MFNFTRNKISKLPIHLLLVFRSFWKLKVFKNEINVILKFAFPRASRLQRRGEDNIIQKYSNCTTRLDLARLKFVLVYVFKMFSKVFQLNLIFSVYKQF